MRTGRSTPIPDYLSITTGLSDLGISYVDSHKDEWLSHVNFIERHVAKYTIGKVEEHVPAMSGQAAGYMAHTLGLMTINALLDSLADIRLKSVWKPPAGDYRYTLNPY